MGEDCTLTQLSKSPTSLTTDFPVDVDLPEEEPVKFILLAEFDIDQGATLTHQYPYPTGTDEHTLAELMLPDGAHLRSEDWTIFYLNQTKKNSTLSVLAHESPVSKRKPSTNSLGTASTASRALQSGNGKGAGEDGTEEDEMGQLLFVLNCVRMKEDKAVRRGATVKALAICTDKPYIQIYKPLLLLALEDFYQNPSPSVLAKLFDSLNGIIKVGCPTLSREEKLILRSSDRRDLFEDRFPQQFISNTPAAVPGNGERAPSADEEYTGSDLWDRKGDTKTETMDDRLMDDEASEFEYEGTEKSIPGNHTGSLSSSRSLKDKIAKLSDGSARRMRKTSRSSIKDILEGQRGSTPAGQIQQQRGLGIGQPGSNDSPSRVSGKTVVPPKDTHFYDTFAIYNELSIPIRIPIATFPEEVSDYSVIQLIQTFSPSNNAAPFAPPFHPHLHSSGATTHPIILLLNALLTQKRIIFLGHGQPAGLVANYVLAACSLTGHVLRGFAERAFPYSNLAGLDMMEDMPGYIAGVTNPRFEDLQNTWDILCNLETGRITISKDMNENREKTYAAESMTVKSTAGSLSSTEISQIGSLDGTIPYTAQPMTGNKAQDSRDGGTKGESSDSLFMEEIMSAIDSLMPEAFIRSRFAEHTNRFIRLAARWEQENLGSTRIHYPSHAYREGHLGSGITFSDDATRVRELSLNAARIDGWRKSRSYGYWMQDFQELQHTCAIKHFDVFYQISRLRNGKDISTSETEAIFKHLASHVESYEQVVELLSYLPNHHGGLMPIALGLFHRSDIVKDATLTILERLKENPIGSVWVSTLNAFQRFAYHRLAQERVEDEELLKSMHVG